MINIAKRRLDPEAYSVQERLHNSQGLKYLGLVQGYIRCEESNCIFLNDSGYRRNDTVAVRFLFYFFFCWFGRISQLLEPYRKKLQQPQRIE